MYCRKKLGRRLIFDRSGNSDQERSLLSKLKQYFGAQFTSKMEGMINDVTVAKDKHTDLENYIRANPELNPKVDLSVQVLTTGYWPTYKSTDINLPSEMVCISIASAPCVALLTTPSILNYRSFLALIVSQTSIALTNIEECTNIYN